LSLAQSGRGIQQARNEKERTKQRVIEKRDIRKKAGEENN
jgi:hypothetical protein